MAELTIPVKNQAYTFIVGLIDKDDTTVFKSSPTIVLGDVKISKDGGALTNLTNTPTASGKMVSVSLTATEMNADSVVILFSDASGLEWCDFIMELKPSSSSFSAIFTALSQVGSTVWNYVTRTLTALSSGSRSVEQYQIDCIRGDSFTYSFTEIDLTDVTTVYFTVKEHYKNLDSESLVQIDNSTGMLYLNGAVAETPTDGSVTLDAGNDLVTVTMKPDTTKEFKYDKSGYEYDLQLVKSDGTVYTAQSGKFVVLRDITRAVT